MLTANMNLVPSYDMLGLPIQAWLAQFLMALTLAAHWAFLSMTAGGAVVYLTGRYRRSQGLEPVWKGLSDFLPFSLAMAMTLGIAPLLFVQVLYGNFFYTANILMGYVWLGLLVLMIVNLYMLFLGRWRLRRGQSARLMGAVVLLLLAGSAMILSANGTLTQSPQVWETFREKMGTAPYLGDTTFLPRWIFAMSALLGGGGLFAAIYVRLWTDGDNEEARREISTALVISGIGILGVLLCGFWASRSLSEQMRSALLNSIESVFAYAAMVLFIVALVFVFAARKGAKSLPALIVPGAAFFVALLSTALLRDTLRRIALADQLSLSEVPVHSQWGSFILFAAFLVLGLGLVAYMVNLSFSSEHRAKACAEKCE